MHLVKRSGKTSRARKPLLSIPSGTRRYVESKDFRAFLLFKAAALDRQGALADRACIGLKPKIDRHSNTRRLAVRPFHQGPGNQGVSRWNKAPRDLNDGLKGLWMLKGFGSGQERLLSTLGGPMEKTN